MSRRGGSTNHWSALVALILVGLGALFLFRVTAGADLSLALGPQARVLAVQTASVGGAIDGERIRRGDRVVNVLGKPVASLADVGTLLRDVAAVEGVDGRPIQVEVEFQRPRHRFQVNLNHEEVSQDGLPDEVQDSDVVVGYGGHEVDAAMDEAGVIGILSNHPGEQVPFVYERRNHTYRAQVALRARGIPALPALAFLVGLLLAGIAAWRSFSQRANPSLWAAHAMGALAAPWALVLLFDPPALMADPVLFVTGAIGLAIARSASLDLHRRLLWPEATTLWKVFAWLPAALFCGVVAMVSWEVFKGPGTLESDLQLVELIQALALATCALHLVDVGLWFSKRNDVEIQPKAARLGPEYGMIAGLAAVLWSLLSWMSDSGAYQGSFVFHLAALVGLVWLGDILVLVFPPGLSARRNTRISDETTGSSTAEYLSFFAEVGLLRARLYAIYGKHAVEISIEKNDEVESLTAVPADEQTRASIGLLRDEELMLPLPETAGTKDSDQPIAEDLARTVSRTLNIEFAQNLFDRNHGDVEFYVFGVAESMIQPLTPEDYMRLAKDFEFAVDDVREIVVRVVMESQRALAMAAPAKVERVEVEVEKIVVERETITEFKERPELAFMAKDLAREFPIDHPELHHPAVATLEEIDVPVILVGPSGSGKEFFARTWHASSPLHAGPFIRFDVAACPPSLQGVELFGDEEEEDSPASHWDAAQGGVLFVEDAVALDPLLIDQLLQRLGEEEDRGLVFSIRGDDSFHPRTLPGSLGDLSMTLLKHRVIRIEGVNNNTLPALVEHYVGEYAMTHNKVVLGADQATMEALTRHPFSAGVTELKTLLEAGVVRCEGEQLKPTDVFPNNTKTAKAPETPLPVEASETLPAPSSVASPATDLRATEDLASALARFQTEVYEEAMRRTDGNKTAAAKLLGVKRSTFVRRLKDQA